MLFYNSLYRILDHASLVLQILEASKSSFGRFADAYITEQHLVVQTSCGGGNRERYQGVFAKWEQHPLYSHNEDCDDGSTHANIYFYHPMECAELLRAIACLEKEA